MDDNKINLYLRAIGDAPVLNRNKFKLSSSKSILDIDRYCISSTVTYRFTAYGVTVIIPYGVLSYPCEFVDRYLRKSLSLAQDKVLYLYCGQGFTPPLDQTVGDLFDCFHTNNELVLSYGIILFTYIHVYDMLPYTVILCRYLIYIYNSYSIIYLLHVPFTDS